MNWIEAAESALKSLKSSTKVPFDFERMNCDEKQLPAFLLPALLSAEKDAKIKQLKNHTGRGAHKNARWTIK